MSDLFKGTECSAKAVNSEGCGRDGVEVIVDQNVAAVCLFSRCSCFF